MCLGTIHLACFLNTFLLLGLIVDWPRTGFGEFNNLIQSRDFLFLAHTDIHDIATNLKSPRIVSSYQTSLISLFTSFCFTECYSHLSIHTKNDFGEVSFLRQFFLPPLSACEKFWPSLFRCAKNFGSPFALTKKFGPSLGVRDRNLPLLWYSHEPIMYI